MVPSGLQRHEIADRVASIAVLGGSHHEHHWKRMLHDLGLNFCGDSRCAFLFSLAFPGTWRPASEEKILRDERDSCGTEKTEESQQPPILQ
jgi:hypothetical protein